MIGPARRPWLAAASLVAALAGHADAQPAARDVTVTDAAGHSVQLSWADLQALPASAASLAGGHSASLPVSGPTLWAVLEQAGAIGPDFHARVRQTVTATGRDGYSATLAMGEIDPEFENKPVLLAIDPERHVLRLAIPGDKRLGRDVRDVVGLAVR